MKLIKKNEQQMKYLYGEELVDALKDGIKNVIKQGNVKMISIDDLEKEINKCNK